MRILIVDDEPGIRKTTRIAIETAGHEAAEAPNGARALQTRVRSLESQLAAESPPIDLESTDPSTQGALQIAFKAADTPANILILGPSGTGKSVLAREIHRRSAQRENAFVTVSCPSLS